MVAIKEQEIVLLNPREDELNEEELNQSLVDWGIKNVDLRLLIIEKVQEQIEKGKSFNMRFTIRVTNRFPRGFYIMKRLSENVTYYAASPVNVYIVIR